MLHSDIVLVVEVKNARGQTPVQFDILPSSGLPQSIVDSQFQLARQLAPSVGIAYYFLVTTDWVQGWSVADGTAVFRERTSTLFAPYAPEGAAGIRSAGEYYLAELTQAWLSDLSTHWRSGRGHAPGEHALHRSGVLPLVRSAATATTATA